MSRTRIELIIALIAVIYIPTSVNTQEPHHPIVKIDHFYAESPHALELYEFFNTVLLLPEVWPFTNYSGFASGGLSLGNAVFEIIDWDETNSRFTNNSILQGIAFEPTGSASSATAWMDRQSIGHSPPDPYAINVDGEEIVIWETFTIEVPPNNATIFVCDYKDRARTLHMQTTSSHSLLDSGGGPVGILACKEIVIAVTTIEGDTNEWIRLLGQDRLTSPGLFEFSEGPAIRLVESSDTGIRELILEVSSLDQAEKYLETNDLMGPMKEGRLTIHPEAVQGLVISLMQRDLGQ